MSEYTTSTGIWNGWYWRFVGLTVLVIVVLQALAYYVLKYPLDTSMPLTVLMSIYFIAPRVKERRFANTLVGVIATFVIGLVLQIALEYQVNAVTGPRLQTNAFVLVFGVLMAYVFLRLTKWSENKRAQLDAKRRVEQRSNDPAVPAQRVHRKKKRR